MPDVIRTHIRHLFNILKHLNIKWLNDWSLCCYVALNVAKLLYISIMIVENELESIHRELNLHMTWLP